jgi:hypothetical protein
MLGFRALLIVRERDFFHAAAATLVGVLGVSGVSCPSSLLGEGESVAKGSVDRKEFFAFVMIFERLESLLDLRGGREVSDWFEWCISGFEVVEEIDMRRMEEG